LNLKRDEVTGGWRKLHNENLSFVQFAKCNQNDQEMEEKGEHVA
jgi:hypothetical protein